LRPVRNSGLESSRESLGFNLVFCQLYPLDREKTQKKVLREFPGTPRESALEEAARAGHNDWGTETNGEN